MMKNPFKPLTDYELDELEDFLLYEVDSDEVLLLELLDGYLFAIAIGPVPLHPEQWLPVVWGTESAVPPVDSTEKLERLLDLVMRHFNGIIDGLQADPPSIRLIWSLRKFQGKVYKEGDGWAYGFLQGMKLCREDWRPMLETDEGKAWYRCIGLLGGDDALFPDSDQLIETPPQRAALAMQIPQAVLSMYTYWHPHRYVVREQKMARTGKVKTGRNEPCPCGSGRKYKKCCGAPDISH